MGIGPKQENRTKFMQLIAMPAWRNHLRICILKSASVPGSHNRVEQETRTLRRFSLPIDIGSAFRIACRFYFLLLLSPWGVYSLYIYRNNLR
jgi:hypothetical protein